MNLLTQVWMLAKAFSDGAFYVCLQRRVDAVLGSEDDGLEVVDPASFVLQPGDLRESFTQSLLVRCHEDGLGPGEGNAAATTEKGVCAILSTRLEPATSGAPLARRLLWPVGMPWP